MEMTSIRREKAAAAGATEYVSVSRSDRRHSPPTGSNPRSETHSRSLSLQQQKSGDVGEARKQVMITALQTNETTTLRAQANSASYPQRNGK